MRQEEQNRFELLLSGQTRRCKERKPKSKKGSIHSTLYYLGYVGEIGFAIAIPIVALAMGGRYLDGRWNTYPKMTVLFLFIGCMVSMIGFIDVIRTIIKKSKNSF